MSSLDTAIVTDIASSGDTPFQLDGIIENFRDGRKPNQNGGYNRIIKIVFQPSHLGVPNRTKRIFKQLAEQYLRVHYPNAWIRNDQSWLEREARRHNGPKSGLQLPYVHPPHTRRTAAPIFDQEFGEEGGRPRHHRPMYKFRSDNRLNANLNY